MLQDKDIKKSSELKKVFTHRWLKPDFLIDSTRITDRIENVVLFIATLSSSTAPNNIAPRRPLLTGSDSNRRSDGTIASAKGLSLFLLESGHLLKIDNINFCEFHFLNIL